jgi:hypothetical protein
MRFCGSTIGFYAAAFARMIPMVTFSYSANEAVQEVSFKILKPKIFKFVKVLKRSTPPCGVFFAGGRGRGWVRKDRIVLMPK